MQLFTFTFIVYGKTDTDAVHDSQLHRKAVAFHYINTQIYFLSYSAAA